MLVFASIAPETDMQKTVIQSNTPWWRIDWRDLVEYRDLLWLLAKRDVTVVYKQTILGPLWFFIQPLITSLVFTVIFGRVAKISTDGIPHFVFYMSGTVIWTYFTGVLNNSGSSLVGSASLLSKVYFPRLIIPLAAVVSNLAFFLLNLAIYVVVYLYFVFSGAALQPTWWLLALPLLVFYTAMAGLGVGLWVAAATTKYRDLRFALPFLLQMWMYATPIVYPASGVVEPGYRIILWINPVSVAVESVRHMFTGVSALTPQSFVIALAITLCTLVSGLFIFNKVQRNFVDTV